MDFGKAISYPFDDEDWLKKLGIALVVGFIPIVNLAAYGWYVKIISNVMRGEEKPLPGWDDFGDFFMKGLIVGVASFIYTLPVFISYGVGAGASAVLSSGGDDALTTIGFIIFACCGCVAAIFSIVSSATFYGGLIRFAGSGTFGTFMQVGDNFSLIRNNLGAFFMAWLYLILFGFLANFLAITIVGIFLILVVNLWFGGHILGQLAQQLERDGAFAAAG